MDSKRELPSNSSLGTLLPQVDRALEQELSKYCVMYDKLKDDIACCKDLLQPHGSKLNPYNYRQFARQIYASEEIPLSKPETPSKNKQVKVSSGNKVYCFQNFDDLLERIVVPETLSKRMLNPEEKPPPENKLRRTLRLGSKRNRGILQGIQALDHFVQNRDGIEKRLMSGAKEFTNYHIQMEKHEWEGLGLMDLDLADSLRQNIKNLEQNCQHRNQHTEVDKSSFYYRRNDSTKLKEEKERHKDMITESQAVISEALVNDLVDPQRFPPQAVPHIYKLSAILNDIQNIKIPVMVLNK